MNETDKRKWSNFITLLVRLCALVAPLVCILSTSMRKQIYTVKCRKFKKHLYSSKKLFNKKSYD